MTGRPPATKDGRLFARRPLTFFVATLTVLQAAVVGLLATGHPPETWAEPQTVLKVGGAVALVLAAGLHLRRLTREPDDPDPFQLLKDKKTTNTGW